MAVLGAQITPMPFIRADQHFVLGQQAVDFVGLCAGRRSKTRSLIFCMHVLGHIAHHAAKAVVVAHHARAGDGFEDIEDQFAFFEGIQRRGEIRAQVVEQHADQDQVVLDAAEFRHDDADVFGAFGHLDAHQLFDGQGIAPVVAHRVEVIEAVGVGHVLQEGVALADLLMVAVQVAHHRFQADDGFAVQHDRRAEHAMRGWVLRSHVDDDVVGLDAVFVLQSCIVPAIRTERFFAVRVSIFRGRSPGGNFRLSSIGVLVFGACMLALGPAALERLDFFFVEGFLPILAQRDDLQSLPTSGCGAGRGDR